jgi:hypothetical protein
LIDRLAANAPGRQKEPREGTLGVRKSCLSLGSVDQAAGCRGGWGRRPVGPYPTPCRAANVREVIHVTNPAGSWQSEGQYRHRPAPTVLTLDQRISDKSDAIMRKFSDSDRLRLIEMHEHRAGVRGLGRDELLAIGFALNRPPSDVTSEILRLRRRGLLSFPPARRSPPRMNGPLPPRCAGASLNGTSRS